MSTAGRKGRKGQKAPLTAALGAVEEVQEDKPAKGLVERISRSVKAVVLARPPPAVDDPAAAAAGLPGDADAVLLRSLRAPPGGDVVGAHNDSAMHQYEAADAGPRSAEVHITRRAAAAVLIIMAVVLLLMMAGSSALGAAASHRRESQASSAAMLARIAELESSVQAVQAELVKQEGEILRAAAAGRDALASRLSHVELDVTQINSRLAEDAFAKRAAPAPVVTDDLGVLAGSTPNATLASLPADVNALILSAVDAALLSRGASASPAEPGDKPLHSTALNGSSAVPDTSSGTTQTAAATGSISTVLMAAIRGAVQDALQDYVSGGGACHSRSGAAASNESGSSWAAAAAEAGGHAAAVHVIGHSPAVAGRPDSWLMGAYMTTCDVLRRVGLLSAPRLHPRADDIALLHPIPWSPHYYCEHQFGSCLLPETAATAAASAAPVCSAAHVDTAAKAPHRHCHYWPPAVSSSASPDSYNRLIMVPSSSLLSPSAPEAAAGSARLTALQPAAPTALLTLRGPSAFVDYQVLQAPLKVTSSSCAHHQCDGEAPVYSGATCRRSSNASAAGDVSSSSTATAGSTSGGVDTNGTSSSPANNSTVSSCGSILKLAGITFWYPTTRYHQETPGTLRAAAAADRAPSAAAADDCEADGVEVLVPQVAASDNDGGCNGSGGDRGFIQIDSFKSVGTFDLVRCGGALAQQHYHPSANAAAASADRADAPDCHHAAMRNRSACRIDIARSTSSRNGGVPLPHGVLRLRFFRSNAASLQTTVSAAAAEPSSGGRSEDEHSFAAAHNAMPHSVRRRQQKNTDSRTSTTLCIPRVALHVTA